MSRKKVTEAETFPGLSTRIKKVRGNLSQEGFGKLLGGVKKSTVCRYEFGRVPDAETLKNIAIIGKVTVEWLLSGEEAAPAKTAEHAPEIYEARPAFLDKDALAHIILLTRDFLRRRRDKISAPGESDLISRLYEYWLDNFKYPDDQVIKRHRNLVK